MARHMNSNGLTYFTSMITKLIGHDCHDFIRHSTGGDIM